MIPEKGRGARVVCSIIPARGGSKGVPRKNIKHLNGKPLIYYSIAASLQSRHIDMTVVSTDDEEIAGVAEQCGAVIVKRPPELARDESPTMDAIVHVIDTIEGQGMEVALIVLLQPTSPLRTSDDIDRAVEQYWECDCDSVVSVCEMSHPPYWSFNIECGLLRPLFGDSYLRTRRQDLPKAYMPNGAMFVASPQTLRERRSFYCPKTTPLIMPPEKSIDIDSPTDFIIAEQLMTNR